jgi:hypothetical protein
VTARRVIGSPKRHTAGRAARSAACAAACTLSIASCKAPIEYDYAAYLDHMPRSILVLPPLDETVEVDAECGMLSRVTAPLAERGYYVFPVAVVEAMMRENGLPTPGEMHQVSLAKLDEVFGADAVMYVDVKAWGTSYHVIDTATVVTIDARLVDVKTGIELWHGEHSAELHSSSGAGDPISLLAAALLTQVLSPATDASRNLSAGVGYQLFFDTHVGLLPGPYDPHREEEMKERKLPISAGS